MFSRSFAPLILCLVGVSLTLPSRSGAQDVLVLPSSVPAPAPVTPGCPTFGQRVIFYNLDASELSEVRSTLEANFTRPVSISAVTDPETGEPTFDIIAVADEFGAPNLWGFSMGLTGDGVNSTISAVPGRRLSAIDAYLGPDDARHYAITWVDDGLTAGTSVGVSLSQLRDDEDANRMAGRRPVWIDGFYDGETTRFSAIWVNDGVTAEMDLARLDNDAAETAWNERTDAGQRMLRMTVFEVEGDDDTTETRRMSVWQTDNPSCAGNPWAGFDADDPLTFETALVAQIISPRRHFISDNEIGVGLDELPGMISVGHLEDDDESELRRIIPQGTPADGTLMVLRALRGGDVVNIPDVHLPTFEPDDPPDGLDELLNGNIRLRRWNIGGGVSDADVDNDDACRFNALLSGCSGQSMQLARFHNRIALAWDAEEEVWREVKREGFLPDRYAPLATDSHLVNGDRTISSTWVGQDTRFPIGGVQEPDDDVSASDQALNSGLIGFDSLIIAHMRGRAIPHATFAVADEGRVMTARHYSMVPESFLSGIPLRADTPFRIASISKPITALAIAHLMETEDLDIDVPIMELPGVADLIGTDWADIDISQVTTRMLLYHTGGWDRDIDGEITLRRDFDICELTSSGLPADMGRLLSFARQEPVAWEPGIKHAYSNFGYTLLGRVIEGVSGQSYEAFVLEEALPPEVAEKYRMAPSSLSLPDEEPVEVIEGYDVRNPLVSTVMGTPILGGHPLRDSCNADHADRVLRSSGLYNDGLMDAHGGWIADALSTARLFSQIPELMSTETYQQLVGRPAGRETRIYQETTDPIGIDHTYQLVRGRHPSGTTGLDLSTVPPNSRIFIGLGYNTFSSIDIELATPATGGQVPVSASFTGAGNAVLSLDITDDGTEGLTQNGAITFEPPDTWAPQARNGEDQRRFWIVLQFGDIPGTAPVLDRITINGHVTRAMAFTTSPRSWTLDVTDLTSPPATPFEIVGAQSQASANVIAMTSTTGASNFTIAMKGQGSFIPGEVLGTVGPNDPAFAEIARVGDSREWPLLVELEHGGSLPGVDTLARRRDDGISWALFFAQGASSTPFYIPRGGNLLEDAIDTMIDGIPPGDWPTWDIAPQ